MVDGEPDLTAAYFAQPAARNGTDHRGRLGPAAAGPLPSQTGS